MLVDSRSSRWKRAVNEVRMRDGETIVFFYEGTVEKR